MTIYELEEFHEKEKLIDYLRSKGYDYNGRHIIKDDSSIGVGILETNRRFYAPCITILETNDSKLKKLLERFRDRKPNN